MSSGIQLEISGQWVKNTPLEILNTTNNRLESINAKLKSNIPHALEEFVDKFFLILRVLRCERDHKAALCSLQHFTQLLMHIQPSICDT